ncbi:MAG: NADH-quinone oxidoreductase subunit A [Fimbriimonadales bacterium]
MVADYAPLLLLFAIAIVIAAVMVGGSWLLGPRRPSPAKQSPYECGITPVGSARERFPIHFYLTAMLFIIFDVEVAFLYPFFVILRELPAEVRTFALGIVGVFTLLLIVGFLYEWKKGALDWEDPVERRRLKPTAEPTPQPALQPVSGEQ